MSSVCRAGINRASVIPRIERVPGVGAGSRGASGECRSCRSPEQAALAITSRKRGRRGAGHPATCGGVVIAKEH